MQKEPLVTAAATAVLAVLVAFGLNLTEVQSNSILGLVAVAAPLVVAWAARSRVASPATVTEIRAESRAGGA